MARTEDRKHRKNPFRGDMRGMPGVKTRMRRLNDKRLTTQQDWTRSITRDNPNPGGVIGGMGPPRS